MASDKNSQGNSERMVAFNLILIWLIGVGASGWTLFYTDWFPAIGGLLSLGGLFSWLAFVSKVLKPERLTAIQEGFEQKVLNSGKTTWFLVVLCLSFLLLFSVLGTVEIKATGASTDRIVYINGNLPKDGKRLSPGSKVRKLIRTSWFSPQSASVLVQGFPQARVTLQPFQRQSLTIPGSFAREVLLVLPSSALIAQLRNAPKTVEVLLNDPSSSREAKDGNSQTSAIWQGTLNNYRGEAFWIGCGPRVDVPANLREQWKLTLDLPKQNYTLLRWLQPRAFKQHELVLKPGQTVNIHIKNSDGTTYHQVQPFVVNRLERLDQFPQLEEIDVPKY